ncbi:TetR/AcrR family transcriptional regulator [Kitasatospora sp. NPDC058965]|uniref:TetR/AcrR family transcriptional regulator n=1 Tax=Kitasatospora sp. NPDC058965 TaxID=3346682 RepID=UPI0036766B03
MNTAEEAKPTRRRRDPQWTYAVLVDALLELLAEGRGVPTGKAIAERAGVSQRTVFVHFADREALYVAAARRQAERWRALAEPVPPTLETGRKVAALLDQRARMYELMTPIRVYGLALEVDSAGLREVMRAGDDWFGADLARTFAPELEAAGEQRAELLAALDGASSWAAWNHLRERRDLTVAQAGAALARTLTALLA